MSTPVRFLQNDIPYHIYNRGNRKGDIFLNPKDYQRFMKRLKEYKQLFNIELLCYCLMPNHFHMLLLQHEEEEITKLMLRLCTSYSKYFNIKHELVGRLFQARFRAKIVETDEYLLHLSRYIHLNPLSADLEDLDLLGSTPGVERGDVHGRIVHYPWSSYPEYFTDRDQLCNTKPILDYFSKTHPQLSYQSFVEDGISKQDAPILAGYI